MMRRLRVNDSTGTVGCIGFVVFLAINVSIGTWSVIEILSWFGKSIPLIGSILLGLIGGEVTIPVALIGLILRAFGVF